jgi:hypothetical protein
MKTLLPLVLGVALAQLVVGSGPAPAQLQFGHAAGGAGALRWNFQGVAASLQDGALHLEVAAGARGTASTAVLPIEPLRLYTLTIESRRGPGCGLSVAVKYVDAQGKAASRNIVFELADRPRPGYWPLAPFRQQYLQQFCLPPGAHDAAIEVGLAGHPQAGFNFADLYAVDVAAGGKVPFGTQLGPNLLCWDDLRPADDRGGLPPGWSTWVHQPERLEFVRRDRSAPGWLRIGPGENFILAAPGVPIERGRAYRVSFRARGKADLGFGVHALENVNPYPLRVGDPQSKSLRVDAVAWTRFESLWLAESLYAASGQLFIGIHAQTELLLDDIALRRIEP